MHEDFFSNPLNQNKKYYQVFLSCFKHNRRAGDSVGGGPTGNLVFTDGRATRRR